MELLARNTETRAKLREGILGYQPNLGRYQPNLRFISQTSVLISQTSDFSAKLQIYQPNFRFFSQTSVFFSQTSDFSAKLQIFQPNFRFFSQTSVLISQTSDFSAKLQIFQPNHQPLTNPPSLPQIPNKNASHMQIIYIQKAFSYYNTLILSRSALSSTAFIYSIISSRISSRCKANSNVVFTNPNVSPTS